MRRFWQVLYARGALAAAAALVRLVEPLRRASRAELHTTLIRNEAAYYGCVLQLTADHPPPALPAGPPLRPLYLCGDSHCFSGKWYGM